MTVHAHQFYHIPDPNICLIENHTKKFFKTFFVLISVRQIFGIGVGVHQVSALSPLPFIPVMEEATKECRVEGLVELSMLMT